MYGESNFASLNTVVYLHVQYHKMFDHGFYVSGR